MDTELIWDAIEEISLDRVRRYADVSGDHNAIHVDPAAARAAGLSAPIAHGLLIVGIVLRHADDWLTRNGGTISGCDTRFVRPVYLAEDPVSLHVTGHRAGPGHIDAAVWRFDPDGVTHRAIIRPIRISYTADADT
ncbi:MaoC family dehydratase [Gordonia insulae]|uniref:MaoC family dehydratase n=1 Tax=Gordonia insulae TaxID=2420509 RepID=UPI001E500A6C|nr:MaoC family dehydratase [Gordonia insulae]